MVALILILGSVMSGLLAAAALRHQARAHLDSAPRCVRYASHLTPERREAVRRAWEDVTDTEQANGGGVVPPTTQPPPPSYRPPPAWLQRIIDKNLERRGARR